MAGWAARVTITVIALLFVGGFWLLTEVGLVEPGQTTAVVGVTLFFVVAIPITFLVGWNSEKKLDPNHD
ncbi:hypothetical protein [Nesterenkonia populi]|uniref:hypothetical protein n=1 Tax=Nesterenkonia populi TaxID=1591087 RepID=UPI0011BF8608|nr:hypothetical protein [Nesterenkonia populi]